MKKSVSFVLTLLAVGVLGASAAYAQVPGGPEPGGPPPGPGVPGGPGGPPPGPGMPGGPTGPGGMGPGGLHAFGYPRVFQGLNLTSTQNDQISAICKAHEEKSTAIRQKLADKHQQLLKVIFAESPDKEQVRAVQKDLDVLQGDLARSNTDGLVEISQVLTADQRAKFLDNLQQSHRNRVPGMGPGMGGGGRGSMPGNDPASAGLTEMLNSVMREP